MKFNVGDKVKYVGTGLPYFDGKVSDSDLTTGMVGVVVEVFGGLKGFPYEVSFHKDKTVLWPMREVELEHA